MSGKFKIIGIKDEIGHAWNIGKSVESRKQ